MRVGSGVRTFGGAPTFRAALIFWILLLSSGVAAAQQAACVAYEHAGFRGDRLQLSEGQAFQNLRYWDNRVSSVEVPRGCQLRASREAAFQGPSTTFDADAPYIGDRWNDRISALVCSCQDASWRARRDASPAQRASRAACVAYDRPDFDGERLELSAAQVYNRLRNWNDRVSSVRLRDGCALRFSEDWNFRGRRSTAEIDLRRLGSVWNNRISAMSCECRADARLSSGVWDEAFVQTEQAPPNLSAGGAACVVYRGDDFAGAWRAFERGEQDQTLGRRLDQEVSSVQVAPGCVALLDVNRQYKLWIDQNVRRLNRRANDRADTVSCFCPRLGR